MTEQIVGKLSKRALLLLRVIDQATVRDKDGKLQRYFVPFAGGNYLDGKRYLIVGAGDAAILRSLVNKGFIEPMPQGYFFSVITKAGKALIK